MGAPIRQLFLLLTLDLYSQMTDAQQSVLKYKLREEQSKETFVGNVARDSLLYGNVTEQEFSRMRFQILTQGNHDASNFQINETSSSLLTKVVLDRETLCPDEVACILEFNVAVYKQLGTNQLDLHQIIPIQVTVDDVNDNSPVFPASEVALTVSEGVQVGHVILTSGAIDRDTGQNNSIQSYELVPSNEMFGLIQASDLGGGSDIGLKVRFKLDRETRDFYELKVIASDRGFPVRTGSVKINITVTDFNDNSPAFSRANYSTTIPENKAVGSTILIVSATDFDTANNAKLTYSFSSRVSQKVQHKFSINSTSGQISVIAPLDYEQDTQYQFQVVVRDQGQPPLSASASVTVDIQDLNDNAPQININLSPAGTDISEAAAVGQYVASVAVSDRDSKANGNARCQVMGNNFRLEEIYTNMYKILIQNKLDYETDKFHNVTVNCQDQGVPQQQNTTSFFIRVQDVNDNAPEFTKTKYQVTMQESNDPGAYVKEVIATDKDSGNNGRVSYSLEPDGQSFFSIDPTMGTISAIVSLDRELRPVIRFHVTATDQGDPQLSSSTVVEVILGDINDNTPTFTQQKFHFHVLENQDRGPKVGTLTAEDQDAGANSQFSFDFVPPIPADFRLNQDTGVITGYTKLDRELQKMYNFTVMVTDKGTPRRYSTAQVTVEVEDDNDNIPVIVHPNNFNNTVYLPYTVNAGTLISQVEAYDIDDGDNSRLRYYIDTIDPPNSGDVFSMGLFSGSLVVARKLQLYDADSYRLVLSVKDGGLNELKSYTNLNVIITVSNNTVLPVPGNDDTGMNIIIVVIIVVVTVVLSIAIVVTIIIIRRIDGSRQENNNHAKNEAQKIIAATAKMHETMSTDSSNNSDDPLKKKNKKEVSFSLSDETDSINTSTLTNLTTFSTFKNPPSTLDGSKSLEKPQASSSLLTASNLQASDDSYDKKYDLSNDSYDRKYDISRLYSPNHLHPQSPSQETRWLQQLKQDEANHIRDMLKKGEDAGSEMSAESATSDSGRGGSEEDVHSNRGHAFSDNARRATPKYPK
ncbi:protocadherin-11 X-linked-like isoform X2 [Mizuhopecten yessoensis]|uniref:protocadherin-11 X-linked-like isoform X2 n=1 Tax=Mizuhopecten yessoensis TaxID=6573 RepID=UPI000B458507|nr:protocadherin-11 X-linked-like isoform X2 [Mizuhopecten yessoensis]